MFDVRKLLGTLFLMSWVGLASAQTAAPANEPVLPAGVTRITSVEGVTEYALPNGLRVLLLPDPSKPTTTINMTVKVGSRHENYGESGMAHLLEHLLFKGTTRHPVVWPEFTKRGLRANGTTSFDRTNYYASFGENTDTLGWYLDWLADALVNSRIAREDLDTEMTVVRNEMERNENSADRILWEKVMATAYQWHNYGKVTIGARSDVENVDIPRLRAFYRKYYQPDNVVLVVGGKFDPATTLATIAARFGPIPKPARVIEPTYTLDPAQDGARTVTLRRNGGTPGILAAYHIPPGSHPDAGALRLASLILGGPNARLHKALVETGLAAGAGSYVLGLAEPGMIFFSADLKSDQDLERARARLIETVEGVVKQPITADELERARAFALNNIERQMLDPERVAIALSEPIAQGDWRLYFLGRDRLRNATLADVQRVATTWLVNDNLTLGLYVPTAAPQRAPMAERVDVAALLKDYKGDPMVASGEVFDPTPDNIDRRTTRGKTGAGIDYALLSKPTRGNLVNFVMRFGLGDEKSLFGRVDAGNAMGRLLGRGSALRKREEIQAAFDRLKTGWGVSGSASGIAVGLQSTRANLPAALELVAEIIRNPNFSQAEFEQAKAARIAALEERLDEPEAILGNTLDRHGDIYPKGDVRYVPALAEVIADVKAVKLEDARRFYEEFYGAHGARFSAVGDFDADALKAQIDRLFGNWKGRNGYVRVPVPWHAVAPLDTRVNVPDKANATFHGSITFPLRETDPDYPALIVANRIFGGGGASRLWNSIREKQGLSYSVYSYLDGGVFNANMGMNIGAIFAPANVDKVKASIDAELKRALAEGFTATELAEASRGLLQSRALARAQEPGLAETLATQIERGITMQFSAEVERKIANITLDEVNAAFRKYIRPEKLVMGVAGAFK